MDKNVEFNEFKDIQDHFQEFSTIIDVHEGIHKENLGHSRIIKKLIGELESSKNSEQKLNQQLLNYTSNLNSDRNASITVLYKQLKEKYTELQAKYQKILEENKENDRKSLTEKNVVAEDYFKNTKALEEKIEEMRKAFLKKESDHCNELEVHKSMACLEYDDITEELNATIQKLRDSDISCNKIRQEFVTFKARSNNDIIAANKRIEHLEMQLQAMPRRLCDIRNDKLYDVTGKNRLDSGIQGQLDKGYRIGDFPSKACDKQQMNLTVVDTKHNRNGANSGFCGTSTNDAKYDSLMRVQRETVCSEDDIEENRKYSEEVTNQQIHVANSTNIARKMGGGFNFNKQKLGNFSDKKKHSNISYLPPLLQVSAANESATTPGKKRRKLYNPSNFDYLHDSDEVEFNN